MDVKLLQRLMIIWMTGQYPGWPHERPPEEELRRVGQILREVDPVSDAEFDEIIGKFMRTAHQRRPPLLEGLAMVWVRSVVTGWPTNRPAEPEVRDVLATLRRVTLATDDEVEDVVRRVLNGIIE